MRIHESWHLLIATVPVFQRFRGISDRLTKELLSIALVQDKASIGSNYTIAVK